MSRKGQMEEGIRSWLEVAGPVGTYLSQPLLPVKVSSWQTLGISLSLFTRTKEGYGPLRGARSNSAFPLGSGPGAVYVPPGPLRALSRRPASAKTGPIYLAHFQIGISPNLR